MEIVYRSSICPGIVEATRPERYEARLSPYEAVAGAWRTIERGRGEARAHAWVGNLGCGSVRCETWLDVNACPLRCSQLPGRVDLCGRTQGLSAAVMVQG